MTIEHVTLDEVKSFVNKIAELYDNESKLPTGVYGVPRGGLVPAVMISHKLGIPLLAAPCDDCLIVDDIADSGDSLIHYDRMGYDLAVIILGPNSKIHPILYYRERQADWVQFFWEYGSLQSTLADANDYYSKKGDTEQ